MACTADSGAAGKFKEAVERAAKAQVDGFYADPSSFISNGFGEGQPQTFRLNEGSKHWQDAKNLMQHLVPHNWNDCIVYQYHQDLVIRKAKPNFFSVMCKEAFNEYEDNLRIAKDQNTEKKDREVKELAMNATSPYWYSIEKIVDRATADQVENVKEWLSFQDDDKKYPLNYAMYSGNESLIRRMYMLYPDAWEGSVPKPLNLIGYIAAEKILDDLAGKPNIHEMKEAEREAAEREFKEQEEAKRRMMEEKARREKERREQDRLKREQEERQHAIKSKIGKYLVWGVNSGDSIYYRREGDSNWTKVSGGLKCASVAYNPTDGKYIVWGVNSNDQIYYRREGDLDFTKVSGGLKQISVAYSKDGKYIVWGVNSGDSIYYRREDDSNWTKVIGGLKCVSVDYNPTNGKYIVWGVNRNDNIYYRREGDQNWTPVSGGLKQISVAYSKDGKYIVWGVNRADMIYYRREGSAGWTNVSGGLKCVSVGYNPTNGKYIVWGVNSADMIYYRREGDSGWTKVSGGLKYISVA